MSRADAPTAAEVRLVDRALVDSATRLVDQLDEVPAGRVLRCFARAVQLARRSGCPVERLALDAERMTVALLTTGATCRSSLIADLRAAGA